MSVQILSTVTQICKWCPAVVSVYYFSTHSGVGLTVGLDDLRGLFQPLNHFCGPPLALLQQVHVFPVLRAPELDAGLQWDLTRAEQRGRIPSLDLLAMLLLMQPNMWLAFLPFKIFTFQNQASS